MPISNRIDLALSLPGLQVLNPMIDDFADRVLALAAISEPRRKKLHEALISAVELVEHALEQDGDVAMQLEISATIVPDSLEFRVLEHGKPLGDDLTEGATGSEIRKRIRPAHVFDHVYWLQKGQEGSELHLVAHRDIAAIEVIDTYQQHLEEAHDAVAHADVHGSDATGDYHVRGYVAEDGLTIAKRVYEAYGRSYPNPDLYIPERIERLNNEGRLHSVVCTSPAGEIVGHFALERPDLGPIGESGQAVIDHRHRGHGLMAPMRAAVEAAGATFGLLGIWSQPTARHPISQRMNLKFGSTPCALCLGTTPAAATLRGSNTSQQAIDPETSKRHSCFLYWHPLTEEPPVTAYVPQVLGDLITQLYVARKREAQVVTENVLPPEGHTILHTRFDAARGVSWISLDNITRGSFDAILAAIEAMKVSAGAATIYIDLPIDDAGAVFLATELLNAGIKFSGIGPRFRKVNDARRAEDVLRLQLNISPVDLDGLVVEGALGQLLADAVLGKK